jgi:hypothetical protein
MLDDVDHAWFIFNLHKKLYFYVSYNYMNNKYPGVTPCVLKEKPTY